MSVELRIEDTECPFDKTWNSEETWFSYFENALGERMVLEDVNRTLTLWHEDNEWEPVSTQSLEDLRYVEELGVTFAGILQLENDEVLWLKACFNQRASIWGLGERVSRA